MQRIPTDAAQPGMVLARPVLRDNGMTVLGKGTELSRTVIDRLSRMGIPIIVVEGNPLSLEDDQGPGSFQSRLDRLDHLFRGYEDDAWMLEVKTFLSEYYHLKADLESRAEKGSQGGES